MSWVDVGAELIDLRTGASLRRDGAAFIFTIHGEERLWRIGKVCAQCGWPIQTHMQMGAIYCPDGGTAKKEAGEKPLSPASKNHAKSTKGASSSTQGKEHG